MTLKGLVGARSERRIGSGEQKRRGVPHPQCFLERVRKNMKRLEIAICAEQKSAEEYENKGMLKPLE